MKSRALLPATIGALGIVYGDIGTSPLYAFKEALNAAGGAAAGPAAIYGVLSLVFWSLLAVVTLKYVVLMLRADNGGEGGILSLLALVQRGLGGGNPWTRRALTLAVLGTALFYCDALITPAISVLSAVEGLELLNPSFERAVIPVTLGIILGLFAIQRHGTDKVGRAFGPVMLLWFGSLAVLGVLEMLRQPAVLLALNPAWGLQLLGTHPKLALVILGAVFLALTGGEALYADMGHFGRRPVRMAWFALVWPALLLNYFGQGALMLSASAPIDNPFFEMAPQVLLAPLLLLATAATVIASQATISGAFSVTRQAVQLDLLPRVTVLQTSEVERGQIFVPATNYFMAFAVVLFVLAFGSSSALSAAYGASVVGTMIITTLLGALVAGTLWKWPAWRVAGVFGPLFVVDAAFVVGNATKVVHGGWVPLVLAAMMFTVFVIWRDGRVKLRAELEDRAVPIKELERLLRGVTRVPGTAVFLVSNADFVPTAMLRNLEHNHVVHERVIVLNMQIVRSPRHDPANRLKVTTLMPEVYAVRARFGFMETPDVGEALRCAKALDLRIHPTETSYFLGWHLVRAIPRSGWPGFKMRVFSALQRRSAQAAEFFRMPARGVVVLATDVEL